MGVPQQEWANSIPNDGLIYYRTILNRERLLLTSPKALAEVLTLNNYEFIKPSMLTSGLGRILGAGLIISEGDEHKAQRKLLMPAFAFRHIKDLYPIFWSKSCKLVSHLLAVTKEQAKEPKKSSAAVVEISNWASRAALDIIGVAGMGKDFDAIANPDTELNVTYRRVFQPSRSAQILGAMRIFLPPWLIQAIPVSANNDISEAAETIKKISRQLIRDKREELRLQKNRTDFDILSVALESGGFSDEELVNQLMTFLVAGHETTATTITWAIYLLCLNPKIQSQLRKDIRAALPSVDSDDQMTPQILEACPLLHAVCNEVLRLYSPVPVTLREAKDDTSILGQPIRKGTTIIISPWATNTSVALWGADARTFNPARWMGVGKAGNGGAESNFAFMTFLHGPRSCIGQQFARAEFACLLAALIGKFEFELEDPDRKLDITGGITAKPKGGLPVKMKVVDGW